MSRLDPRLLLQGYATGIFPMADSRDADELFWVEPRNRAIIPLDRFHVSRSLSRTLRSGRFQVTRDRDFAAVITACADREETWINAELEQAMIALHGSGHAHSIEVWHDGRARRRALRREARPRLLRREHVQPRRPTHRRSRSPGLLRASRPAISRLLDCQFMTDHLASLGAVSVTRETYVALLAAALGGGAAARGCGAAAAGAARVPDAPPDFGALDRLLELAGAAGAAGPAGYVISQLLGQTS